MVLKNVKSENIYKIRAKMLHNIFKTTFIEKCIEFTINTRENFTNYFCTIRSTKYFVDWVSANYNGYYMQGSGKSDKYGFTGTCLICIQ